MENKDYMHHNGIWEDDITRELKMKEEEEIQKQAEGKVQKMLKDGNVELFAFLKEPSTVAIEEIEDSQPMLALENSTPVETCSEDDTDVDEPPICPMHLMR